MTGTHKLARRDGRSTSFEAAAQQTESKRHQLYSEIMRVLVEYGPMIDEKIQQSIVVLKSTPSGVRSRRNELVAAGWVTEERDEHGAVVKRIGRYGSPCTVWRAVRPDEEHETPAPYVKPSGALLGDRKSAAHKAGLAAAKRAAEWHTGDADWGRLIVDAYLDPDGTNRRLDEEQES